MKTIKVKDLIEVLQGYNQESEVFLSSDEGGNGYSTIDKDMSFEQMENGRVLLIYPYAEGIEYDDLVEKYGE
jgi:hypothetical protein